MSETKLPADLVDFLAAQGFPPPAEASVHLVDDYSAMLDYPGRPAVKLVRRAGEWSPA